MKIQFTAIGRTETVSYRFQQAKLANFPDILANRPHIVRKSDSDHPSVYEKRCAIGFDTAL